MTKRVNMSLDDDAAELLHKLASVRGQGEFVSSLIRAAAARGESAPAPASAPDDALHCAIGREVVDVVKRIMEAAQAETRS